MHVVPAGPMNPRGCGTSAAQLSAMQARLGPRCALNDQLCVTLAKKTTRVVTEAWRWSLLCRRAAPPRPTLLVGDLTACVAAFQRLEQRVLELSLEQQACIGEPTAGAGVCRLPNSWPNCISKCYPTAKQHSSGWWSTACL